jgi:outer membrane protein assembly factor BamE (lipoprotein component of BamABCDE complex)
MRGIAARDNDQMNSFRQPGDLASHRGTRAQRWAPLGLMTIALMATAGCMTKGPESPQGIFSGISETTQHGYVVPPDALQQIPVGSSRDQVLIALGSPSTTANFGNEVFYYISQTRHRAAAFLPDKVVDQHVVAVYFDSKHQVQRVANYGLQDGKIFDFVSRTTPTGGADQNFIQQVFNGVLGIGAK